MRSLAQTVEEFGADERRVYLIGVSMGGYGVWHFAAAYPEKFAALVSICGGSSITKGDRFDALARKVGKTPAWLFHGADDKVVQVSESRQIVKALESNGGDVKYNEYENVGHNVWFNVLAEKDLLPWLFAQRVG
jgi:predicted peptidase